MPETPYPRGGTITISTQRFGEDHQVRICIEELGIGIRPEDRHRIFGPFFTTKANEAGTGLGLLTSAELIERYDGTLAYQPNEPTGSKFIITLLLSNLPAFRHSGSDEPVYVPGKLARTAAGEMHNVMVIDDDDAVRKVAIAALQNQGFKVITAVNSRAGLAVLETEHQSVDLVLLNLTMPGIPGEQVLLQIRQKYPHMPVVVCSGYFADHAEFHLGTQRLSKPYSSTLLLDTVKAAIGKSQQMTL